MVSRGGCGLHMGSVSHALGRFFQESPIPVTADQGHLLGGAVEQSKVPLGSIWAALRPHLKSLSSKPGPEVSPCVGPWAS